MRGDTFVLVEHEAERYFSINCKLAVLIYSKLEIMFHRKMTHNNIYLYDYFKTQFELKEI